MIRLANISDAELIADLSRDTFYESFAPLNKKESIDHFMEKQFTRESLIMEVGAPGNIFYLAFLDHQAVGYIRLRENNIPPSLKTDRALELARIYVRQSHTGSGIGSSLLETAIEYAEKNNFPVLWLGVWEHNPGAISFYTRWGFEKFADATFILGEERQNDWLMRKII